MDYPESDEFLTEIDDLLNLGPESEKGNVEFKRTLAVLTEDKLERRASQMQRRLKEGMGECIYVLGVDDDGTPVGLTPDEMLLSAKNLGRICQLNDYTMSVLVETSLINEEDKLYLREYLIRETNVSLPIDIRIAMLGNVDAGKSTLVGSLTTGILDNGRGLARSSILVHAHERESGNTSDISHKIMGFGPDGSVVNYRGSGSRKVPSERHQLDWEEIYKESSRIINFIDLCGHLSFSKTTVTGMSSSKPDYAMLLVNSKGFSKDDSTLEHMRTCHMFNVPYIIVMTKIDLAAKNEGMTEETLENVTKFIRLTGKQAVIIKNITEVIEVLEPLAKGFTVPIFKISTVTGEGLEELKSFLNLCKQRLVFDADSTVRFSMEKVYTVKGTGTVLGGCLDRGTIRVASKGAKGARKGGRYYLGPTSTGDFKEVVIRSIQVKRVGMAEALAGRYVCLGTPEVRPRDVYRGMALLDVKPDRAVYFFDCSIVIRSKKTITVKEGFNSTMIEGNLRVPVRVVKVLDMRKSELKKSTDGIYTTTLKAGDRGRVTLFSFHRPIYLEENDRVVFMDNVIRIMGMVKKIHPFTSIDEYSTHMRLAESLKPPSS